MATADNPVLPNPDPSFSSAGVHQHSVPVVNVDEKDRVYWPLIASG